MHAGQSSVLAMGDDPASTSGGWSVNLRAPWDSEAPLGAVILKDAAMGGSGTSIQGYHILDPRTGAGARGWAASWVACPGFAALADALSTAFMVLDADEIRAFCSERPQISALAWREGEALAVGPLFENLKLERAS